MFMNRTSIRNPLPKQGKKMRDEGMKVNFMTENKIQIQYKNSIEGNMGDWLCVYNFHYISNSLHENR